MYHKGRRRIRSEEKEEEYRQPGSERTTQLYNDHTELCFSGSSYNMQPHKAKVALLAFGHLSVPCGSPYAPHASLSSTIVTAAVRGASCCQRITCLKLPPAQDS